VENEAEISDIVDELVDRFGNLPPAAENLVNILKIKAMARQLGIGEVVQQKNQITALFVRDPGLSGEQWLQLATASGAPLQFGAAGEDGQFRVGIRTAREAEGAPALMAAQKLLTILAKELLH
jgi:transcription-repair coupling factor (superfamily II helicase)